MFLSGMFIVLAALFFISRYIVAAICLTSVGNWDSEVFKIILQETGQELLILSIICLIVSVICFWIQRKKSTPTL